MGKDHMFQGHDQVRSGRRMARRRGSYLGLAFNGEGGPSLGVHQIGTKEVAPLIVTIPLQNRHKHKRGLLGRKTRGRQIVKDAV